MLDEYEWCFSGLCYCSVLTCSYRSVGPELKKWSVNSWFMSEEYGNARVGLDLSTAVFEFQGYRIWRLFIQDSVLFGSCGTDLEQIPMHCSGFGFHAFGLGSNLNSFGSGNLLDLWLSAGVLLLFRYVEDLEVGLSAMILLRRIPLQVLCELSFGCSKSQENGENQRGLKREQMVLYREAHL